MVEKRIDFEVPVDELNENDIQYEQFIQGKRYAVPKGKEVQVPQIVKDIYKETTELARKANKSNNKLVVFE